MSTARPLTTIFKNDVDLSILKKMHEELEACRIALYGLEDKFLKQCLNNKVEEYRYEITSLLMPTVNSHSFFKLLKEDYVERLLQTKDSDITDCLSEIAKQASKEYYTIRVFGLLVQYQKNIAQLTKDVPKRIMTQYYAIWNKKIYPLLILQNWEKLLSVFDKAVGIAEKYPLLFSLIAYAPMFPAVYVDSQKPLTFDVFGNSLDQNPFHPAFMLGLFARVSIFAVYYMMSNLFHEYQNAQASITPTLGQLSDIIHKTCFKYDARRQRNISIVVQIAALIHLKPGREFKEYPLEQLPRPPKVKQRKQTSNPEIQTTDTTTDGECRALTLHEIKELVICYANAAKNAIKAGFDGIEIHGANGYLIDQFLHYDTNKRDDEYGGTPENIARFAFEVVKACGEAIGYERVGLRLSPGAYLNEIVGDQRDASVFQILFEKLNHYPIAYVHTGNFNDAVLFDELNQMTMTAFIRSHYHGTVIAAGGYTIKTANEGVQQVHFDLVAIGRPFISNPDLISRIQKNDPLVDYDANMLKALY